MKAVDTNPVPNARKPSHGIRENALNRLCHSLEAADNSKRFKAFPEAYCHSFGLTRDETHAVTDLDIPRLLQLGARLECLALLTAVFNLDVCELGAQQSGLSVEQFEALTGGPCNARH
jgi:protocatechuate 4,5-dioxygenase alpha chain